MNDRKINPSIILRRIAAYLSDYLVVSVVLLSLQGIIYLVGKGFPFNRFLTGFQIELWIFLTISLPVWLYFALNECSLRKATPGKRLFKLQVTDLTGNRISFWRAFLRTIIKLIPWELTHITLMVPTPLLWDSSPELRPGIFIVYVLLGVYFLSMLFNQKRQSIHDLVAGTIVNVKNNFSTKIN